LSLEQAKPIRGAVPLCRLCWIMKGAVPKRLRQYS